MSDDKLHQAIARALLRMDKTTQEAPSDSLSDDEAQILSLLGAAVVAEGNSLDRDRQRTLFERATKLAGPEGALNLRQDIATFLHDHNQRTAATGRREG